MQLVISCFPGGGKSTICKEARKLGMFHVDVKKDGELGDLAPECLVPLFDSDSSLFPKDGFPQNYIDHIKGILETYPDVVIMVSSHDNVREALAENDIPFVLAYPQRELKDEYLNRYKERGSHEKFVEFMENNWNNFITSAEEDPNETHLVIGEGKYLLDVVKEKIDEVVLTSDAKQGKIEGFESIGDIIRTSDGKTFDSSDPGSMSEYYKHKESLMEPIDTVTTTTTILDVNADTGVADSVQAEPTGGIVVPVINEPANPVNEDEPNTAQPAVDASTVDDSAMDHSELVEAHFDVAEDVEGIELVLRQAAIPELAGNEAFADGSNMLVTAAAHIHTRYGAVVEPTLAGMEGFLDKLKTLFDVTKEKFKKKSEKKGKIQKYVSEAEKAVNEYKSDAWINKQELINVGKVKLQAPELLATVNTPGDIKTIIDLITKQVVTAFDKHLANDKARIVAATKAFNKVKNLGADAPISKLEELLPIKPEELEGGPKDAGLRDLKLSLKAIEVPVLNKDGIKEACAILDSMLDEVAGFFKKEDSLDDTHISEDDWWDSEYLEEHMQTSAARQLWDAGTYYSDIPEYAKIDEEYGKLILAVGKFLESWILKSTK